MLVSAFTDELCSGVVPSGSPELLAAFGLTPAMAAGWTLFAYTILGVLIEPWLLAQAHGRRARPMMLLGLFGMAGSCLLAALSPSYPVLLLSLLIFGPSAGLGASLAQAALMGARPHNREATLARWTFYGGAGDLLAPLALAASVGLGLGWRGALGAAALVTFAQAFAVLRMEPVFAADEDEDDDHPPALQALADALRCKRLLKWALLTTVCVLLDEVVVAFGALHLQARFAATATERAANFSAWVAGGLVGAAVLERVGGRFRPSKLLFVTGAGSAIFYVAWLFAPSWQLAALLFALAGTFTAAHYPLLHAQAYAALPERPHVVAAVASVVGTAELFVPLLIGLVADHAGVSAAMWILLLQPFAVLLASALARREQAR